MSLTTPEGCPYDFNPKDAVALVPRCLGGLITQECMTCENTVYDQPVAVRDAARGRWVAATFMEHAERPNTLQISVIADTLRQAHDIAPDLVMTRVKRNPGLVRY